MSERAAFVTAILDNLADDTPRLVFADWLEEHDEPERAEFIRCQIEAAKLADSDYRASLKPQKRAAALLKKHEKRWRAAIGGTTEGTYVRGFLYEITSGLRFRSSDFPVKAGAILEHEPITEITLDLDAIGTKLTAKWIDGLAANPHLRAVTSIYSDGGGYGGKNFARLMKSPHFVNLRRITFFEDEIGSIGVQGIAESPSPFKLDNLDLFSGVGDPWRSETKDKVAAVKILATSPRFSSLTYLGLASNSLGNKCIEVLLKSKTLPQRMELNMEDNGYDTDKYDEKLAARFMPEED